VSELYLSVRHNSKRQHYGRKALCVLRYLPCRTLHAENRICELSNEYVRIYVTISWWRKLTIPRKIKSRIFLWYDTDRIENDASRSSYIVVYVFVAAVTFLLKSCLAMIRGYTYRHTDWWEGFMRYAAGMGSGAMMYIPSFIKIDSCILKLIGRYTDTQTTWWLHKPTIILSE
jgi:hypothetical protein